MSRAWRRNPVGTLCGGPCGRQIQVGEPIFELRSLAWTEPKVRCASCAGEPVPSDLPPLPERTPIQPTAIRLPLAQVTGLPTDFKALATGEREPGEEG